ncbi:MAG: hypothetical protein ACLUI3_05995 [Christensenellales bacterium]
MERSVSLSRWCFLSALRLGAHARRTGGERYAGRLFLHAGGWDTVDAVAGAQRQIIDWANNL